MFNKINKIGIGCMAILVALVFASCKKSGTMVTATSGTQPGFSVSSTDLQFTQDDAANTAVTFNWTPSDFGAKVAINYTLQLSMDSTFAGKVSNTSFVGTADTSQSFTVDQFNTMCLNAGVTPFEAVTMYARIQCAVATQSQNSAPLSVYQYSPVIAIRVDAPYKASNKPAYPSLWVPGDYQGWSPGAANCAELYSPNSNSQYEGYVMISPTTSADSGKFKLTQVTDPTNLWATNWGSDGTALNSGGTGTLVFNSSNNLQVAGPGKSGYAGYWLITADISALTWTATLNNWGICGTVENNGWDNTNPIPFSFDVNNQVLVDTLTCVAGDQFKFIANDDWTLNYGGDYDASTGKVTNIAVNGDNITIPTAGAYIVTLDLRVPSEPACTILPE